jgi:predicted aspartyl protease
MGVFYVDCSVANMAEREKPVSIEELIVDIGSEFTWLPENVLSSIGVKVEKRDQKFVMANGEVITRDIGYAIGKANGFETVDEIVFARRGDLNLLGPHLRRFRRGRGREKETISSSGAASRPMRQNRELASG